jgi:hypothetical protein
MYIQSYSLYNVCNRNISQISLFKIIYNLYIFDGGFCSTVQITESISFYSSYPIMRDAIFERPL